MYRAKLTAAETFEDMRKAQLCGNLCSVLCIARRGKKGIIKIGREKNDNS